MNIILATANAHKMREIEAILDSFTLYRFSDFISPFEIEENGTSFAQNALIKAQAINDALQKAVCPKPYLVLAEDSGICVEALNGEPGIYSARYAHYKQFHQNLAVKSMKNSTDKENLQCVITMLQDKKLESSKAYFVANVALVGEGVSQHFEGILEGYVITTPKGVQGFGYDPIFIPIQDNPQSLTLAEFSPQKKNLISHRRKALEKCQEYLQGLYSL
uniref:dITP/XTP pyrophosphatase n=1 Tax=uncultured Helicobacter sp. TaxID=175537 RepID=A0A650EMN7_9HELI|nr:non-canonical purine NTP pyrophosphatase [uncultured Helicobacter sp.]